MNTQLASIRALTPIVPDGPVQIGPASDTKQPLTETKCTSTRCTYMIECDRNECFYGGEIEVKAQDNKGKRLAALWSRFRRHRDGQGAEWTKLHGARRIVHVNLYAEMFDEDKLVLQWMVKHGIDKVRGGQWSRVRLPTYVVDDLQRSIWHAQRRCLHCGSDTHFVNQCPTVTRAHVTQHRPLPSCWSRLLHRFLHHSHVASSCVRCGRSNHTADACYAKTNVWRQRLGSDGTGP